MLIIALVLLTAAVIGLVGVAVLLIVPLIRGAPFYPSSTKAIRTMVALAVVRPGECVADLGAGDGRVLIAFAQAGAEAHGYEINPVLVGIARRRIHYAGLRGRAFVSTRGFWREDLGSFDVVAIYGIPHIMRRLEEKLRRELHDGARVVSNVFSFPEWPPERVEGKVFLYRQRRAPALPTRESQQ